jgi:GTP-binding protein HflX
LESDGDRVRTQRLNPTSTARPAERALVVEPVIRGARAADTSRVTDVARPVEARIDEAIGLARALDLEIVHSGIVPLKVVRPATFIGKGKTEELAGIVKSLDVGLVVMDCALSPVQQRNLETAWGAKVIDRTGLILEIFGRRARTREGTLQVEHAHLTYQKSRLVRSWTHLERQRGGYGFLGGPGETQIEADRRVISERLARIEADLEKVKRTRKLHRDSRKRVPYPVVAFVGYTNAGKSTLFNRLTRASVLSADMLFATLDPTLRGIDLPHGGRIILSDTVGFISDLPTMLVAAFRATLEEVIEADVIAHVRDISHGDSDAQAADVRRVLGDLGIDLDGGDGARVIEIWNQIDKLDPVMRTQLENTRDRKPEGERPVMLSAVTGEGTDTLLAEIEGRLSLSRAVLTVHIEPSDGKGLSWLYRQAEVLSREDAEDGCVAVTVRADSRKAEEIRTRYKGAVSTGHGPGADEAAQD